MGKQDKHIFNAIWVGGFILMIGLRLALAHVCPIYDFQLDTLATGVVERTVYYPDFALPLVDTISEEGMTAYLASQYRSHAYVAVAAVPQVEVGYVLDSLVVDPVAYIFNYQTEKIQFTIEENLKGSFPAESFSLDHQWIWNDSATLYAERDTNFGVYTYEPLQDSTILIFANLPGGIEALTLDSLNIGFSTECTPLATAFYVREGRIYSLGEEGGLFAGLSISMEDFLEAATAKVLRQNNSFRDIKITGQPGQHQLTINNSSSTKTFEIKLLNSRGTTLRNASLSPGEKVFWDDSQTPAGIYYIQVTTDKYVYWESIQAVPR